MGINDPSNEIGSLQIGPTTDGMVRLYVEGETFELPLDFTPEEAEEIANEILAAAEEARAAGAKNGTGKPRPRNGSPGGTKRKG